MRPDPAIEIVRRVREEISDDVGHDPAKLIERYLELQKRFSDRLQRAPIEEDEHVGDDAAEE
jgi:hypothetical protein